MSGAVVLSVRVYHNKSPAHGARTYVDMYIHGGAGTDAGAHAAAGASLLHPGCSHCAAELSAGKLMNTIIDNSEL